MEVLKEFLESSTIHGMSYISRTRSCMKFMWIMTVVFGFISAGLLISQSYHNWRMNPIATTITTAPIEQVTYPLIYVCPPRNTFTNLNYDLVNVPDERLEQDYVNELVTLVDEKIQDAELEKALSELDIFEERNKFRNWYLGITELKLPNYYYILGYLKHSITYKTTASSGMITSPFFGSTYNEKNFYFVISYIFDFYLPLIKEERKLNFNVDIDTKETEGGSESFVLDLGTRKESYKLTGPMTRMFSFNNLTNTTKIELSKI